MKKKIDSKIINDDVNEYGKYIASQKKEYWSLRSWTSHTRHSKQVVEGGAGYNKSRNYSWQEEGPTIQNVSEPTESDLWKICSR